MKYEIGPTVGYSLVRLDRALKLARLQLPM